MFIASTHSYILFFTSFGRCYWLKVYELPQGGRAARGRPIVNMLQLQKEEELAAYLPVREFTGDRFVLMATRRGKVKKTPLTAYSHPRRNGINAITIGEKDALISAELTNGRQDIVLQTRSGQAIRFNEQEIRPVGRTAQGVRGIKARKDDDVVGMVAVNRPDGTLMVVCRNGYGKRTTIDDFRITHRGGKGIISIKTTERNGDAVTIMEVVDDDELVLMTRNGILIRVPVRDIRSIGRVTQGVRLINLEGDDIVMDVERVNAGANEDIDELDGNDELNGNGELPEDGEEPEE